MAAAQTIADDPLDRWRAGFEEMFALVAGQFAQVESRRRARMYPLGLLSGAECCPSLLLQMTASLMLPVSGV